MGNGASSARVHPDDGQVAADASPLEVIDVRARKLESQIASLQAELLAIKTTVGNVVTGVDDMRTLLKTTSTGGSRPSQLLQKQNSSAVGGGLLSPSSFEFVELGDVPLQEYPEQVLLGPMKLDHFEGIHKLPTAVPIRGKKMDRSHVAEQVIPGVANFRKVSGFPVFGVFQCTVDGIRAVVEHLEGQGFKKIRWANMREEPVVFVNGLPFAPREEGRLNDNVDYLLGVTGPELERMELRLKRDVAERARENGGMFEYYHQKLDMSNELRKVPFDPAQCTTLHEVYGELVSNGHDVNYRRIPIQDECAPERQALDDIVRLSRDCDEETALVFNCQMGRGRTTTAMVCACLLYRIQNPHKFGQGVTYRGDASVQRFKRKMSAFNVQQSAHSIQNLERVGSASLKDDEPEYECVTALGVVLDNGAKIKEEVDDIIDLCSHMQNLRSAIQECKESAENAGKGGEGRGPGFWYHRGNNYLQRYWFLIVFNAYLHYVAPTNYEPSFSRWMRERWGLKRMMKTIELK